MAKQPLGEALSLCTDSVPVEPNNEYRIAGVYGFGRGLFQRGPIAGSETSYATLNRLHAGDLVMSRLKAFEGAIAVVDHEHDGWFLSPEFPTFRPRVGRLDPMYLGLLCRWPDFWELLRSLSRGIGSRRERVHPDDLLGIEINLPPIDEQRRVAKHLGATADASSAIADLARRAQELGDGLAVSIATRPDLDDAARRRAGWVPLQLGELLVEKAHTALSLEPDGRYPIAGIYSYGRGLIDRGVIAGSETSYKTLARLDADDVVFSKLNAWEGAVTVVPPSFDGFFVSSEYPTFGFDHSRADPHFLGFVLRSPAFWGRMNNVTQGSMVRRRRINTSQFLGMEIWLPSVDVQTTASELIAQLESAAGPRQKAAERLTALLPAAMNEAFSDLR